MFKDFFNLNSPLFWTIIQKFTINLAFLFLLIRIVYYRYSRKGIYVFSLFLMGIVIFILGSMLPIVFVADVFGGSIGNGCRLICHFHDPQVQNQKPERKRYGIFLYCYCHFCCQFIRVEKLPTTGDIYL